MRRHTKAIVAVLAVLLTGALAAGGATADTLPSVSGESASEVGVTTAKLSGQVNPNGSSGDGSTTWRIQFRAQGSEDWQQANEGTIEAPASEEAGPVEVEAVVGFGGELAPGETYEFRLVAENGAGTAATAAPYPTFTMDSVTEPALATQPATEVGYTSATLHGTVDPEGGNANPAAAEVKWINWVLQHSTDGENWNTGAEGWIEGAEAESSDPVAVSGTATGLAPGTSFQTRLFAYYMDFSREATSAAPYEAFETDPVTPPSVAIDAPSDISESSAHLSGTVNPNAPEAGPVADPDVEAAFRTSWHFECTPGCGSPSGEEVEADNGTHTVEADAVDLEPNRTYEVRLIASNAGGSSESAVEEFTTEAIGPTVAPEVNSPVGPGAVTIRGFVNPHNSPLVECRFEFGLTNAYGQSAPCADTSGNAVQSLRIMSGEGQFRLEFRGQETEDLPYNASAGAVQAALESLSTIPPGDISVTGGPGSASGQYRYVITFMGSLGGRGDVGVNAMEGTNPLTGPPVVETLDPGGLNHPMRVEAQIDGLTPGARYHYRLVVDNGVGVEVAGEDGIVDVPVAASEESCPNADKPGAGFLPDCRAWEMVSPPANKNGMDVLATTTRSQAAADGSAISFASNTAFGDIRGTGLASEYISQRSVVSAPGHNGWATHGISPYQEAGTLLSLFEEPLYVGEFSPDLTQGVFFASTPLTDDPSVALASNLYLREDLRTPGPGSYQLLTACPLCDLQAKPLLAATRANSTQPIYGGASANFDRMVFESPRNLTSDAPLQTHPQCPEPRGNSRCLPRAYEWSDGQLQLIGYVPSGSETSCGGPHPPCVVASASVLGRGVGQAGVSRLRPVNVISDDGSKIFFSVPTDAAGNVTNTSAEPYAGRIYVRTDSTTTDLITATERSVCISNPSGPTCTYRPAVYRGASADGSRVFFTSAQPLTDDSNDGLYMYDTSKPASNPDNLTLLNVDDEPDDAYDEVTSVIATSEDGAYVYFVQRGQLVRGAPSAGSEERIFVWHEGEIDFIGTTPIDESGENSIDGWAPGSRRLHARITPDGRHLLFNAHLGGGFGTEADHARCFNDLQSGCRHLYLYSAETSSLVCVSCNPNGEPPTTEAGIDFRKGNTNTNWHLSHALSSDGKHVFFTTGEALLPDDTNGVKDAYEYDVETAELHLISSGTDPFDSIFVDASSSGDDAFILTREQLVGWDVDSSEDLYDARVDGGFPDPDPKAAPCSTDSCRLGIPVTPPPAGAASATFSGPGDRKVTRRRCGKGRHAVRTRSGRSRCVKRKHRRSNHNRPAGNGRRTPR